VENPRASITTQSLAQLTELKALAKSSVDEVLGDVPAGEEVSLVDVDDHPDFPLEPSGESLAQ
jgi:hypothetical protein